MANPRKFSEKIALHNQKQAEETAAFERIMQEVSVTRVIPTPQRHLNPHPPFLRPYLGGSLPNVNQMSGPPMEMPVRPGMYDEMRQHHHLKHQPRFLPYTNRRPGMPPDFQNRHHRHLEGNPGGPYSGPYLSPPADTSWRSFALSRTNSDSALHQSVMNPNAQDFNNPVPHMTGMHPPPRRDLGSMNPHKMVMDPEKLQQQLLAGPNRPKSCEDAQIVLANSDCQDVHRGTNSSGIRQGMPPNPTNAPGLSHVTQIGNNTGSLPDLTNIHIPSPLSNPIDYDGPQKQLPQHNHQQPGSLQSPASMLYNQARSTGNLAAASAIDPRLGGQAQTTTAQLASLLKELQALIDLQKSQIEFYRKEAGKPRWTLKAVKRRGASGKADINRDSKKQGTNLKSCRNGSVKIKSRRTCTSRKKRKKRRKKVEICEDGDISFLESSSMNQAKTGCRVAVSKEGATVEDGLNPRGSPASPSRSRRHTHNGPSPLSLSSPDQSRRIKFHGGPSPKLAGIKPDLKSPPIGGPYPYAYPLPGPGMQPGLDGRVPGAMHRQLQQQIQQQQQQGSAHPVLRVDVNAASKVGQYPNAHMPQQVGPQRHSSSNMTSPITSPTSPTSRGSLSPGASPQHLPELTSTSNPALSEAYYRNDPTNMQPLQHQFEHFHVVNDIGSTAGMPRNSVPPPVYSSLQMLSGETGFPQNSYGVPTQRTSDSSIYTYNNGSNSLLYKNLMSPTSKIPDIVFTGVDDPHSSKLLGSGGDLGYGHSGIAASGVSDFGTDYFPGDDLKVNLGLEELQMLEEPNIIEDPSIEDDLHLNS